MNFQELIISAKSGDKDALTKLYIMYNSMITKYSLINDVLDDDLYQELSITFLKVIMEEKNKI